MLTHGLLTHKLPFVCLDITPDFPSRFVPAAQSCRRREPSCFPDSTSTLHSTYWTRHSLVSVCLSVCYKSPNSSGPGRQAIFVAVFPILLVRMHSPLFLVSLIIVSRAASLGRPPLPMCSISSGVVWRDALSITHGSKPVLSFLHPPFHSFPNSPTWTTPGFMLTTCSL